MTMTFEEFVDLWMKAPEETKKKVEEMLDAVQLEEANDKDNTTTVKGV